jgi:hypothetical protein
MSTLRTSLPRAGDVDMPSTIPPRLVVVIDTEEEFDWSAPPSRANTSVTAMRHIDRVQRVFDRFRLRPTYVIDYPVASQAEGYEPLLGCWQDGRCHIGAHLHPWVNPPFAEPVTPTNTFMMNLPVALQREKLEQLTAAISLRFDAPRVFKAGRYGLGRDAVSILDDLRYSVDASVCPRMDFSDLGGPSFADFDASPFMLTSQLLEIPCTVGYVGWLGSYSRQVHSAASAFPQLRGVGVLARLGAVNRVMLSPEGNTLDEMCQLARTLVAGGYRLFTLSFHSPSVEPGHTPYVRTRQDVEDFVACIDRFCEYFMVTLGGVPETPLDFYERALSRTGLTS